MTINRGEFMSDTDGLRYTKIPLNNGSDEIPALGFGTLIPDPIATKDATKAALEVGFRQFDCAERYRNVDLYCIHTPFAFKPGDDQDPRDENANVIYDDATTLTDTWMALESLVDERRCKVIGLSNVSLGQLKEVFESARVKPAVLQVESHPYLPQWELLDYCKRNGIVMQAFAALGHGIQPRLLDDPVITGIAKRVHKTPAQVLLAWAVQRITAPLTTATSALHIRENLEISTLPDDAIEAITQGISTRVRLNSVVDTGIPGFIPRGK